MWYYVLCLLLGLFGIGMGIVTVILLLSPFFLVREFLIYCRDEYERRSYDPIAYAKDSFWSGLLCLAFALVTGAASASCICYVISTLFK